MTEHIHTHTSYLEFKAFHDVAGPSVQPFVHLWTPPGLGLQSPSTEEPLSSGPLTAAASPKVNETFPSCPRAGPGTQGEGLCSQWWVSWMPGPEKKGDLLCSVLQPPPSLRLGR